MVAYTFCCAKFYSTTISEHIFNRHDKVYSMPIKDLLMNQFAINYRIKCGKWIKQ